MDDQKKKNCFKVDKSISLRGSVLFFKESYRINICVCVCSTAQSCLTLCNPMDCNLPGSSLQGSSQPRDLTHVSYTTGGFLTTEPPVSSFQMPFWILLFFQVESQLFINYSIPFIYNPGVGSHLLFWGIFPT